MVGELVVYKIRETERPTESFDFIRFTNSPTVNFLIGGVFLKKGFGMKKIFMFVVLLGLGACRYVSTPVINQTDLSNVNFRELQSKKMGAACTKYFLFIPLTNYISVAKAAFEAGIEHVSYVEYYGTLAKECVLVYGE